LNAGLPDSVLAAFEYDPIPGHAFIILRTGEGAAWSYAFEPVDTPVGPTWFHSGIYYPTDVLFLDNLLASTDAYAPGDVPW
jgi:hypothetical protein